MHHNTRLLSPAFIARTALVIFAGVGSSLFAAPAVTSTKSDGTAAATKVAPGSTVTYTTSIANSGPDTATDVVFKDPEINGATYVGNSLSATPVAVNDTFGTTIVPNTTVTSGTFSVVDNDLPGYVSDAAVLRTALTITSYSTASTQGGVVSMTTSGPQVGRFTYSPAPGFTGTDTFSYTISNTVPNGPSGSITATVTLTVSGNVIWFVNPGAGANGNGTLASPFNVLTGLSAAITASATTTDRVFIYGGGPPLTTGITLPANTIVVGQGTFGGNFESVTGVSYPAITTTAIPGINGASPVLTRASGGDTVTLGQNNVITGVAITNTGGGYAVRGTGINVCQIGSTANLDVTIGSSGSSSGAVSFTGAANGAIAINAPISTTVGRSVNVQNRSGSTVTFSRLVSDSSQGISLSSNGGSTISFTGGLDLKTGINPAFSATGGGTITASQDNSEIVNSIVTTTGQALNVVGTTIGSAGLNFRSIASNGSSTAINLSSTGSTGGLSITGNSTADSGGIIQNTTGDSIRLVGTSKVSFARIRVRDSRGHGIFGTEVNGFILNASTLTGNGNASTENGIRFADSDTTAAINETGLYGTATGGNYPTRIINSSVTGSRGNNLEIVNYGPNVLSNLSIEGSTFSNSVEGGGIQFEIRGSGGSANNSTVNVTGCTINDNFSQGIDGQAIDDAAFTINVGTTGLVNNAEGIVLVNSFNGDLTYDINGNTINNNNASPRSGAAIACANGTVSTASAIYKGKVRNNIINTGGIDNSGLTFYLAGDAVSTLQLDNNNITVGPDAVFEGVFLQAGESGGTDDTVTGNLTVTNNTVAVTGEFAGNGMLIQSRFSATARALISGNVCTPGTLGDSGIRIRQRDKSRFEIPGYTGTAFDNAAVQAFVDGNNPSPTTFSVTSNNDGTVTTDGYFNTAGGSPVPLPLTFAPGGIERAAGEVPAAVAEISNGTPAVSAATPLPVGPSPAITAPGIPVVSQVELDAAVAEAIGRWKATGLTAEQVGRLRAMQFKVSDLEHNHLGETLGDVIRLDPTAGRNGWFTDSGESSDGLFGTVKSGTRRQTDSASAPAGRVDLLTTVMHEMGHALGLSDSYHPEDRESIMYGLLVNGERRFPAKDQAKGAVPFTHATGHFLTGGLNPLAIGDLPPGKEVIITYNVTVNSPATTASISSQATVSGTNFTDVLTDDKVSTGDPLLPGAADPTVTLIDIPLVSVALGTASIAESNGTGLIYTFSRTGNTTAALPINFSKSGTAAEMDDFTASSSGTLDYTNGTLTIPAGQASATVTLVPVNDRLVEGDETQILGVAAGSGYLISGSAVTGTITDDDSASIGFAAATSSAAESAGSANVTVSLAITANGTGTIGLASNLTANFNPTGGSALSGTDYSTPANPAVSFAAGAYASGSSTTTVAVIITDDAIVEGNETAVFGLAIAQNIGNRASIGGTTSHTLTITDDDTATVTLAAASADKNEGTGGTTTAFTFSVTLDAEVAGGFTLPFTTNDGTATVANSDYVDNDGSLAFTGTPGETRTITVLVNHDSTWEPDETFTVALGTATGTTGTINIAGSPATGTIRNDDLFAVTIAALDAAADENTADPGAWRISRNGTVGSTTVQLQIDAASTASAADWTQSGATFASLAPGGSGTVTIPDGQSSVDVTLTPVDDIQAEAAETVILKVTADATYTGTGSATVTIAANDFVVTATSDSGEGSLRQAVLNANAIAGADTITFAGSTFTDTTPDTITLTTGVMDITTDVTLVGPGPKLLSISGNNASRILSLTAGIQRISGITFTGGNDTANGGGGGGGAISAAGGSVSIINCAFVSNVSAVGGGAIINYYNLSVTGSSFSGNSGPWGGAIANATDGSFALESTVVTNSTFSGNSGTQGGGGIYNSNGLLTLKNCTITGNNSPVGSGILTYGDLYTRTDAGNTLIAGNTGSADVSRAGTSGTAFLSLGGNLIGNTGTITDFTATGDQVGTSASPINPNVGPLADNGGATLTHALLPGSPALNGGLVANIPADTLDLDGDTDATEPIPYDQRGTGFIRSVGTPDIGAFELQKGISIVADASSYGESAGNAVFTVSRTGPTTGAASVTYTVSGTGTYPASAADVGGTFPTGTATIADGASSTTVSIPITNDTIVEQDETFQVTLTGPSDDYSIVTGVASVTITDNDTATLSVAKITDGAEDGPVDGLFRITQSALSSTDTTVSYSVGGTAQSGTDFTALSGTATIPANSATVDISVPVIRDLVFEAQETVTLTLTTITAGDADISIAASPANSASMTITDDPIGSVVISSGNSQSATVNTAFGAPLVASVRNNEGSGLQGVSVTYTAPSSGAAGTFSGSATATVTTNSSGLAVSPTFTANTAAGNYTVAATVAGVATPTNFSLTNTPGAAASFAVSAPATATAGTSFTVTATARDAFGNTVTGYNGTVQVTSNDGSANLPSNYTFVPGDNGSKGFAVTLNAGGNHTVTVTNTVTASVTGTSGTIAVTPVSDVSVAMTDSPDPVDAGSNLTYTITATNNGPSAAGSITWSDTLPAGTTFVSISSPGGFDGTAPAVGSGGTISGNIATLAVGASKVYTLVVNVGYLPNATVLSNTATFTVANDPNSANNSATATTTVSAIPEIAVFDGPTDGAPALADGQVAAVNFGSTTYNNPLTRTFTIKNVGTGPLNVSGITMPSGFSLPTAFVAQAIAPTASITFTARYDAPTVGTTTGTMAILSDDSDEGSFDVPVSGTRTNIAPVAVAASHTTDEDVALQITLDVSDGDNDVLTYSIIPTPANGSIFLNGNIVTYVPNHNYNGPDSFTFKVNDGTADSNAVTISITVNPVNDTPVVVAPGIPDVTQIKPGLTTVVDLKDYFSDIETASTALTYVVTPASGTPFYTLSRNGTVLSITGVSPGTVDITVTASDSDNASATDTFTLHVKQVPTMPGGEIPNTLVSPSAASQTIDLGSYFSDADGDVLTYTLVTNSDPSKATASVNGSILSITPLAPGITNLTVRATDSDGNFIEDVIEITVDDPIPTLAATPGSPPLLNHQTGLYEISITATNDNQFDVPGFRLRVTSALPSGFRLQNATSPAGEAQPYLDVLTRLAPGQSIVVVLEFFSVTRDFTGFNPTVIAEPLPTNITNVGTGTGTKVTRFLVLPDHSMLLEFESVAGRYYEVEYSSDCVAWKKCLVPIHAAANRTQWIDRGAPYTDAHPGTVPKRFYRVSEIITP